MHHRRLLLLLLLLLLSALHLPPQLLVAGESAQGAREPVLDRRSLCLVSEDALGRGGFSNSVALANSLMHTAILLGLGYAHKPIIPAGHNIRAEFADVFRDEQHDATTVEIE
jgi:hypothetical protein